MFLNIGRERLIPLKEIVAILDRKVCPGFGEEKDNSVIILREGKCTSPFSSATLVSRIHKKIAE